MRQSSRERKLNSKRNGSVWHERRRIRRQQIQSNLLMKTQHRLLSFGKVSAALLLTAGALYAADAMVRYEAQPESKVRIDGTSTIHDWTVQGTIIGGFVEADPTFAKAPGTVSKMNPKVEVTIPVRSLKSDQAKAMDNVMYEAMKQKEFPKIEYRLK